MTGQIVSRKRLGNIFNFEDNFLNVFKVASVQNWCDPQKLSSPI